MTFWFGQCVEIVIFKLLLLRKMDYMIFAHYLVVYVLCVLFLMELMIGSVMLGCHISVIIMLLKHLVSFHYRLWCSSLTLPQLRGIVDAEKMVLYFWAKSLFIVLQAFLFFSRGIGQHSCDHEVIIWYPFRYFVHLDLNMKLFVIFFEWYCVKFNYRYFYFNT